MAGRTGPLSLAGLLLALAPIAHGGCTGTAQPPPALRGVRRIVALGDSITEGGGAPGGYVWLVEQTLRAVYPRQRVRVINAGIGGQRAPDMAARFRADVLDRRPQLVTISAGVNDVWHAFRDFAARRTYPSGALPAGVPLAEYREHVTAMVQAAREAGVRVLLVSPTVVYETLDGPENTRLAGYVDAERAIASERGVLFADAHAAFRAAIATGQARAGGGANLLTFDGVHPNPAGSRLLALVILRALGVPEEALAPLRRLD